jgi:hypothetical protein
LNLNSIEIKFIIPIIKNVTTAIAAATISTPTAFVPFYPYALFIFFLLQLKMSFQYFDLFVS